TGTVNAPEVTSYVDGPLAYKVTGAKLLTFPIGKGANARPVELNIVSQGAGENTYTAEQFDATYVPLITTLPQDVTNISKIRYFKISQAGTATVSAKVKLTYASDDVANEPGKLTIVKYGATTVEDLMATDNGDNTI